MKASLPKFFFPFLFSFAFWQLAPAQNLSREVDRQIQKFDSIRNAARYGVGLPLNLNQTIPNYCRSTILYLHDELSDQIEQLIQISPLPKSPLDDPGGRQVLEEHIAASGRMAAKMKEYELVSKSAEKEAKVSLPPLKNPFSLLPDRRLLSYQHDLLRAFAQNEGFVGEERAPFRIVYGEAIGALEEELKRRGLFPKLPERVPNFKNLSEKRFALIEKFNEVAIREAMFFVDDSPLALETREEMGRCYLEILDIEKKMNNGNIKTVELRNYFTDETVEFKIYILEHAHKQISEKHYATQNYADAQTLPLRSRIDEQLAEEKKWAYRERNQNPIKLGYAQSPPPDEPSKFEFNDRPFPKRPSGGGGGLTLSNFIDELKAASIDAEKKKAFDKIMSRQLNRFKAWNLGKPNWETYELVKKTTRTTNFKTPETYLRFLATRHLETLALDPIEAAKHKAEFEVAMRQIYPEESETPTSFLKDNPAKLEKCRQNLKIGLEQVQKQKERLGMHTPASLLEHEKILQAEIKSIEIIQRDASIKPRIEKGQWKNRPPPTKADFPTAIFNEAYAKNVWTAQLTALKNLKAVYGLDAPASLNLQVKALEQILTANKMVVSLREYQRYAQDATRLNILETLSEYDSGWKPLFAELKANQQALFSNFHETFARFEAVVGRSVFSDLYKTASKAHKALTEGNKQSVKKSSGQPIWRSNQLDLEQVREKSLAENAGGIWLSPSGLKITPNIPAVGSLWVPISEFEDCPNSNDFEWILDPDAEEVEKICYPQAEKSLANKN